MDPRRPYAAGVGHVQSVTICRRSCGKTAEIRATVRLAQDFRTARLHVASGVFLEGARTSMRKTMLVGAVLVLATVVVVLVSAAADLKLESVTLMGAALGAVVALVPDRSPLIRLAGFAGGVVVAWIGFFLRAGLLPDSAGGARPPLVSWSRCVWPLPSRWAGSPVDSWRTGSSSARPTVAPV